MPTYIRHQEITHRIGQTGMLGVKITDGGLRLRAIDGDEVRLRATFEISAASEEEADRALEVASLEIRQSSTSLEVRDRGDRDRLASALRRLISGRGGIGLSVEGEAPRRSVLELETVSGDLVVEGMQGEQRYTAVSGDLFATELGGEVRVASVSGDVTIRATEPLVLRAKTVSGDLSAMAPLLRELGLTSVSGDLEVEGELDRTGEFRAETVSGDLTFGLVGSATFEVRGISSDVHAEMDHRLEGRTDRRRVVIGDGNPQFIFSSMSGDVVVRKPRRLERRGAARPEPATAPSDASSLEVLRALERGEIDVEEATRRLAGGSTDA